MSGFESSSFKKNVPAGKPMREFTVGPPEFEQNQITGSVSQQNFPNTGLGSVPQPSQEELEAQVREARRQKLANISRINDAAKQRIELLGDIGRLTKDVQIGGFSFSLRTLKAKEAKEAAIATFTTSVTQLEASYEARRQQLARSILKIDGEDIEVIIGSNRLEDKLSFIEENLEDVVVEKLWSEFVVLKEEAKQKYGITSAKEAEEVVEDLKK